MTACIDIATSVYGREGFYGHVRLPDAVQESEPVCVTTDVWTRDMLAPRLDNLGLVVVREGTAYGLRDWEGQLRAWQARGILLPVNGVSHLLLRERQGRVVVRQALSPDQLAAELRQRQRALFSPKALLAGVGGQATFAALESEMNERSFAFLLRQHEGLVSIVERTLAEAVEAEKATRRAVGRYVANDAAVDDAAKGDVVEVGLAYVAARILWDKGFFGPEPCYELGPEQVLAKAVQHVNGFLARARSEALGRLGHATKAAIARGIGLGASFALMDYKRLGGLFEHIVHALPATPSEQRLQRHYTPTGLADRILERLPLERIRPDSRVVFDPAAGSGSLLLSSSRRLGTMSDIPTQQLHGGRYLREHVAGNDIDRLAKLVTELRYALVQKSYGLPFESPEHFGSLSFESLTSQALACGGRLRPSVFVANPPFEERAGEQVAAIFVERALQWMRHGDLFGFVLPQTFLASTTHRYGEARRALLERCRLFEVWEFPEGAVGLAARQATCVLLGECKDAPTRHWVHRSVSRGADAKAVAEGGHLGQAWIKMSSAIGVQPALLAGPPRAVGDAPTVALERLFHVFIGVTPQPGSQPVADLEPGILHKRYWLRSWLRRGSLWADPEDAPEDKRWIRYARNVPDPSIAVQREFLKRPEWAHRRMFDLPKVMVGRSTNTDSKISAPVWLDTEGLCPNSDVYCIATIRQAQNSLACGLVESVPAAEWRNLPTLDQLYWLLGLLSSSHVQGLLRSGRSTRHLGALSLRSLPLPMAYDPAVVDLAKRIVAWDMGSGAFDASAALSSELDSRVARLYGVAHDETCGIAQQTAEVPVERPYVVVTGQVLSIHSTEQGRAVEILVAGLTDDEDVGVVPMPPELPGWALDGAVFTARLDRDALTFAGLRARPSALRRFRHSPRPYLGPGELGLETGEQP